MVAPAAGGVKERQAATGEALFRAKCIMCHGEYGAGGYALRSIQNVRADRIRLGMGKWPDMAFLTYLTDPELTQIATYLGSVPKGTRLPCNGNTVNGEQVFRKSCTYCHSFGGAPILPARPGPDLKGISSRFTVTWLGGWTDFPREMVAAGAYSAQQVARYPYLMPDLGHVPADVWDVGDFLFAQDAIGPLVDSTPVTLTPAQFEAPAGVLQ